MGWGVAAPAARARDHHFLVLGNQKLREEALLVARKSRYLCTVEIKLVSPIPAFSRPLFVYSYLRYQRLTSLTSGCSVRALQASTPVPALFTVCGKFRGKEFWRCLFAFVYTIVEDEKTKGILAGRKAQCLTII